MKKLGGKPAAKPTFNFPVKDEKSFLKLAVDARGHRRVRLQRRRADDHVQGGPGRAGSIVQVEARHAAAIRLANGQPPAPDAFDKALEMPAVLKAVQPLIKARPARTLRGGCLRGDRPG